MDDHELLTWNQIRDEYGLSEPSRVYEISYTHPLTSGTIPVEAQSRREAVNIVQGRLGPETVAVVTGVRA